MSLSRKSLVLGSCLIILAGCERLGISDPVKEAAQKESDSKATGSACRHAGRAIEDCYTLNPEASRAAVFSGWKEMNDYMRENNIQDVKPELGGKVITESSSDEGHQSESASASTSASAKSGK